MDEVIAANPLDHLDYFVEWGGRKWERLLSYALRQFTGTDLTGRTVLDLGTRYGKTAVLFALLGAEATGVDTVGRYLPVAEEEAKRWEVSGRTRFVSYDGDLDVFPDASFDLIFTKSVLIVVRELPGFLRAISAKLKPQGQVVFLENGRGGGLLHAARALRHRRWDYATVRYFTERELTLVRQVFEVKEIRKSRLPPIYLILGHKR